MNKMTHPHRSGNALCLLMVLFFSTALTAQSYSVADFTWLSVYIPYLSAISVRVLKPEERAKSIF